MREEVTIKQCERCKQTFECKPGNITECQCYGLSFSDEQKNTISGLYADCLCRSCLVELGATAND